MAGRPEKNSARLRQALSTVYASDTRSGSREFQASSPRPAHQKFTLNVRPAMRGVLITEYGCWPHSGVVLYGSFSSTGGLKVEHCAKREIMARWSDAFLIHASMPHLSFDRPMAKSPMV